MDRRSTLFLESMDCPPERVAKLDGEWAFLVTGFAYLDEQYPSYYFTLLACSRSWMAAEGWNNPPAVSSETWGDGYLFPWGLLVMTDKTRWEDIERAVGDIVEMCDKPAGEDRDKFMRLMSRFVVWDDDEFRYRNWTEA